MKTLFVITVIVSAMIGVAGRLDRDGGLNDEWARLLPMNILEHGPSPVEHRSALLEERIRRTREEIARLRQELEHERGERGALEQQLQAHENAAEQNPATSVLRVLRRSIERKDEIVRNLELRLETNAERLQALEVALLAVQHGLDPWLQDGSIEFDLHERNEKPGSGNEHSRKERAE